MQFSEALSDVDTLEEASGIALISGVEYDSRKVKAGDLFVAMRGETTDGNRFVGAAIEQGASALVMDSRAAWNRQRLQSPQIPAALVEHGRHALARVSANVFGHPERALKLSGVTGTNGKTTTAFLLEAMLRSVARRCVLVGTIEYHVGDAVRSSPHTTPESRDLLELFAEGVGAGATEAVMEVSSHALEQGRVWGLEYDTAIFTNLTQDHLDYHKTMASYAAAKRKLFEGTGGRGPRVAILNRGDAYAETMAEAARNAGSEIVWYGIERGDFRAEKIVLSPRGTRFEMVTPSGRIEIQTRLAGQVNVLNLLAASAAAIARGLTLDEAAHGAALLDHVPGRFQAVDCGQQFTVVVDYAHTDDALRNLIGLAREFVSGSGGRVITMFGCGGDRDKAKRPRMGCVAGEGSDFVVLTSDNPRSEDPMEIIHDALLGLKDMGAEYVIEADRAKGIQIAIAAARPGDIVLLAGKGHEKVQVLRDGEVPFDDVETAREALRCR